MDRILKIAVCDDVAQDRCELAQWIEEFMHESGQFAEVSQFSSGEALLAQGVKDFALVFLDIFLDGRNGLEIAKEIAKAEDGPKIVFCSSSNAFAADSYDVSALYYLTKPIDRKKLFSVLDRFFYAVRALKTITVKVQRLDKTIFVSDILWVESQKHVCILHTRQGDVETRTPFAQLCSELLPYDFIRPIRYALVSLKVVTAIPGKELSLSDGTQITISQNARAAILQSFTEYKWNEMLRKAGDGD